MAIRSARTGALGAALILAVALLAGCSPTAAPDEPTPGPDNTPTPSATPTSAPVALRFTQPTQCTEILPAERLADFASRGLELLGGPGGVYGADYLADPTPEERAGGITCIWGDEDRPESVVTVSVAPVSLSTRASIVNDLIAQGLNESTTSDGLIYAQSGDEVSAPAILNYVRNDSWISVIEALGGVGRFAEATTLVEEVTELVYS